MTWIFCVFNFCFNRSKSWQIIVQVLGTPPPISLRFGKTTCLRNITFLCYSLHAASDSSDPSGHSSSPSHFHLAGMQWPLSQVKSDSAQVFFAARKKKKSTWHEYKQCRRPPSSPTTDNTDCPVLRGFISHSPLLLHDRVKQISKDGCFFLLELLSLHYLTWIQSFMSSSRHSKPGDVLFQNNFLRLLLQKATAYMEVKVCCMI